MDAPSVHAGKIFPVSEIRIMSMYSNGIRLPAQPCYKSGFTSPILGMPYPVPEQFLEEVDMDEGFVFDPNKPVWIPNPTD